MGRLDQERYDFLLKHEHADELVFSTVTGAPLQAVYYSYDGHHEQDLIRFLAAVQEAMMDEMADEER